jgi:hypothetical protein
MDAETRDHREAKVHTHFGSATEFAQTLLSVLLGVTLWRLAWGHAITSKNPTVQGLARAALFQL